MIKILNIENQILTSKFFEASNILRFSHIVRNNNSEKLSNSSKENISFDCFSISSFFSSNSHIRFDMVDSLLDDTTNFVDSIPFFSTTDGTRIKSKIFRRCSISSTTTFCSSTRIFTRTSPFAINHINFRAIPLNSISSVFFVTNTSMKHRQRMVVRTYRDTVFVNRAIRFVRSSSRV